MQVGTEAQRDDVYMYPKYVVTSYTLKKISEKTKHYNGDG